MNKQSIKGIEWTNFFGPGTGFTANPVRGCVHGCKWRMSDGTIVDCYAETLRDRLDGVGAFKNISFHLEVFDKIRARQQPAGIFIDSMSDLFGDNVPFSYILKVVTLMRECQQHVFFTLTKNPRRLCDPHLRFPNNVLVGLSAPPTFMYDHELSEDQQRTWFRKGLEWLNGCDAKNIWLSMEPLTLDLTELIATNGTRVKWAVIGAGSNGTKKYQPSEVVFSETLKCFDKMGIKTFFKGNIDTSLADKFGGWRSFFPTL